MRKKQKHSGMSLTEILVVMAVIAILMGVSIPAAKQLANSFESGTGVRQLINAALSSARSIAIREQTYAGVRFQEDKDGNTYIIFIVHDPDPSPNGTGLAYGFRAVMGRKPMKLPEDVGVLSSIVYNDGDFSTMPGFNNAKTFSIVFSPQGKLTVHPVRVRNKNGFIESTDPGNGTNNDTIFNTKVVVELPAERAMFYQDDYPDLGLDEEDSTQSFRLYSKSDLNTIPINLRGSNYFSTLNPEYISPYTGELVMEYREQKP